MCGSLNGELLASTLASVAPDPPPKPLVRSSLSVAPADYPERPEVLLRREASSSAPPLKTEVPLHLFSTTNQQHKPVGVQQQIPTKLAALSSGKGKAGKSSRASHRSDSSGEPWKSPPSQGVTALLVWRRSSLTPPLSPPPHSIRGHQTDAAREAPGPRRRLPQGQALRQPQPAAPPAPPLPAPPHR